MHLDPDFKEFVELFTAHDVRFLVVGGYALAAHELPRATGDFDAWVWIDQQNARRIVEALTEFGFGQLDLTVDDFNRPDSIVQLGYPPYRIDLPTTIDGVDFDEAWRNRVEVRVDGNVLNVRVSTLRQYLEALGARLELVAVFDDDDRRVPVHLGKDSAA